jgi:hydrogenase maturation protease
MNPVSVLRTARAMNIELKNILLVGCEPETLGGEEGQMGLSPPVEAAVDEAVKLVKSLIDRVQDKVQDKVQGKVQDKRGPGSTQ